MYEVKLWQMKGDVVAFDKKGTIPKMLYPLPVMKHLKIDIIK